MTSRSKTAKTHFKLPKGRIAAGAIKPKKSKLQAAEDERKRLEAQRFPKRSPDYSNMSERERWEDDKKHGYLDME